MESIYYNGKEQLTDTNKTWTLIFLKKQDQNLPAITHHCPRSSKAMENTDTLYATQVLHVVSYEF